MAGVVYPRNFIYARPISGSDFKVNYGYILSSIILKQKLKASVLQNYRWSNAKIDVKPQFIGMNELNFDLNGVLIFPTMGREFRYFDIRSLRFRGQNIEPFGYT